MSGKKASHDAPVCPASAPEALRRGEWPLPCRRRKKCSSSRLAVSLRSIPSRPSSTVSGVRLAADVRADHPPPFRNQGSQPFQRLQRKFSLIPVGQRKVAAQDILVHGKIKIPAFLLLQHAPGLMPPDALKAHADKPAAVAPSMCAKASASGPTIHTRRRRGFVSSALSIQQPQDIRSASAGFCMSLW